MEIALRHALVCVSDNGPEQLVRYLAAAVTVEPVTVRVKDDPALGACFLVDADRVESRIEALQDDLVCDKEVPPLAVEQQIAGLLIRALFDYPPQGCRSPRGEGNEPRLVPFRVLQAISATPCSHDLQVFRVNVLYSQPEYLSES